MNRRKATGQRGEALAVEYLTARGFAIVHRNWRCSTGELDIVMEKDQILVFVEVRTRTSDRFGTPEESITSAKRKRLIDLAHTYLQQEQPPHTAWRIDVVALNLNLSPPVINHLENAVGW